MTVFCRILTLTFLVLALHCPAHAALTVTPRLGGSIEYTDNVNRTKENKQDDITYVITPGITLNLDTSGERWGLALSYDPGYVSYRDGEVEDNWRHYGSLDSWYSLSPRTQIRLVDSLTVSEDPADNIEDQSGTRTGRDRYVRNSTGVNLRHRFGPSDSFNLGYEYLINRNDGDRYEDSTRHNPYGDLTWWFAPGRYGLDLNGSFTRGEFERSDDFDSWRGRTRLRKLLTRRLDIFLQYGYLDTEYSGESEDFTLHDVGIGFNYVVGEHVDTSFTASYLRRDRELTGEEDDYFLSWDINGRWPLRRGSYGVRGSSGYTQDQFGAEGRGFSLYSGITGDVNWQFTRTVSGDLFARYRYNKYIDYEPEIENQTVTTGAGLSWDPLSWMRWRLRYTYDRVFSDDNELEYTENRVFLSVTFSPRPVGLLN